MGAGPVGERAQGAAQEARGRVVDLAVVVGSAAEELEERIDQRRGHGGAHLLSCFVVGLGLDLQIAAEDSAQYRRPGR